MWGTRGPFALWGLWEPSGWERAGPSNPRSRRRPGRLWSLSGPDEACSGRPRVSLCAFQVWSSVSCQNPAGAAFFLGRKPVSPPLPPRRCFCSSAPDLVNCHIRASFVSCQKTLGFGHMTPPLPCPPCLPPAGIPGHGARPIC